MTQEVSLEPHDPQATDGHMMKVMMPFLIMSVGGFAAHQAWFVFWLIIGKLKNYFYCSISLRSSDRSYKLLLMYLVENNLIEGSMAHVKATKKKDDNVDEHWWYN
jgi:hypothetical protein